MVPRSRAGDSVTVPTGGGPGRPAAEPARSPAWDRRIVDRHTCADVCTSVCQIVLSVRRRGPAGHLRDWHLLRIFVSSISIYLAALVAVAERQTSSAIHR